MLSVWYSVNQRFIWRPLVLNPDKQDRKSERNRTEKRRKIVWILKNRFEKIRTEETRIVRNLKNRFKLLNLGIPEAVLLWTELTVTVFEFKDSNQRTKENSQNSEKAKSCEKKKNGRHLQWRQSSHVRRDRKQTTTKQQQLQNLLRTVLLHPWTTCKFTEQWIKNLQAARGRKFEGRNRNWKI